MDETPGVNQTRFIAIVLALLWGVVGVFGSQLIGVGIYLAIDPLVGELPDTLQNVLLMIFSGVGLVILAGVFLHVNSLTHEYIDIEWPSLRDLGYVIVGVGVLFGALILISIIFTKLGIQGSEHEMIQNAKTNQETAILLALVPLSVLVVGPTEELFYRNIVQKSLYEHFDRRQAVVIASVIFTLIHLPAYATSSPLNIGSSLLAILVLSLILGEWYRRTENLTVPILVHGLFNAIQFYIVYAEVQYDMSVATMVALV